MEEKAFKKPALQSRSRETVKAILEATTRILGKDGLAKLSTNRIAEVAGVSVGSLYQFFRNKNSILTEVFNEALERNFEHLMNTVRSAHADESVQIRSFVTGLIEAVFENFEKRGAIQRILIEQAPELIGFRRVKEFDARITPVLLDLLKRSEIKIRPADPEMAVFVLLQSIRGVVAITFMKSPTPEEIGRAKRELIELCTRYLEPTPES